MPDGVAAWERGEVADLGHCFLRHADKYYDSNHPEGVADWRELLRT